MVNNSDQDRWFDNVEAAAYIGLTNPDTLTVWRCKKKPAIAYYKVGRKVRYKKSSLDEYLLSRLRR